jgi:hypothetical protein
MEEKKIFYSDVESLPDPEELSIVGTRPKVS